MYFAPVPTIDLMSQTSSQGQDNIFCRQWKFRRKKRLSFLEYEILVETTQNRLLYSRLCLTEDADDNMENKFTNIFVYDQKQ